MPVATLTEIQIYPPKARKAKTEIEALIPQQALDALQTRLGEDAALKAKKTLTMMKREGIDLTQFRLPDGHRIRIKQG